MNYLIGFVIIIMFFFLTAVSGNIVFISGVGYGLVVFFRKPLQRIATLIKRPLLIYGLAIIFSGLVLEVLAYLGSQASIARGEQVFLFSTRGLASDLFIAIPVNIFLGVTYMWLVKKYRFSVLELGFFIWLYWALTSDTFSHFFGLLSGNIFGFIIPGLLMLFTFHWPYIVFEKEISKQYQFRSDKKAKYFWLLLFQLGSKAVAVLTALIYFGIFRVAP